MGRVREFFQRNRKWFAYECMEENSPSRQAEYPEALFQPELDKRVKPGDVVDMEVGKEETDRLILRDIPVGFGDPIAGIEDDIIFACLNEYRNRVAGGSIEPAIGAKEGDLHREKV
jgi:hypothetical protein